MSFLFGLIWILSCHSSPEVWASNEGQPRVIGPSQPIVAAPGDDVILPCHLEPRHNVEEGTVEWSNSDLKPDPLDPLGRVDFVHLYRDGRHVVEAQLSSYIGRTDLFADGLRHGNISLRIRNVTLEDGGRYRCFIPKLNSNEKESFLHLIVDPNVKTSTTTTPLLHHTTVQPPGPKDETKGVRSRLVLLVIIVLLILILILILGVAFCLNKRDQKNLLKGEDTTRESSLAEDV